MKRPSRPLTTLTSLRLHTMSSNSNHEFDVSLVAKFCMLGRHTLDDNEALRVALETLFFILSPPVQLLLAPNALHASFDAS